MKKYFKSISLLAIALVLVFASCKKDDDNSMTPEEYLTAGNWKVTGMTINPPITVLGIEYSDIYTLFVQDCDKDDLIKFNSDGTLTEDEGPTKCDPDDPQTTTDGTWTLSENGVTLTINYPGDDPEVATVKSLNGTNLVISSPITEDFGLGLNNYTATITMTLQ